jgi:hypothetical protein
MRVTKIIETWLNLDLSAKNTTFEANQESQEGYQSSSLDVQDASGFDLDVIEEFSASQSELELQNSAVT